MDELVRIAIYLNIAGEVLLLARLSQLHVLRSYRYFSIYIAFSAIHDVVLALLNPRSPAYFFLWIMAIPVIVSLLLAATLEVYRLMIRNFIGLGKWGGLVLIVAAGIAMGLAAVIGILDANALFINAAAVLTVLKRWAMTAIAVLLVLCSWFFFRFDYMLPRNVVIHSRLLTIFCLINAADSLALILGMKMISTPALFAYAGCFFLWTVLLARKGEQSPASPVNPAEVERIREMQRRIGGALGLPRTDRDDRGGTGVE